MSQLLYVKTEKGRQEIETRSSGLTVRMRRLLILIDGQRTLEELMSQTGLSTDADTLLDELEMQGFITRLGDPVFDISGTETVREVVVGTEAPPAPLPTPVAVGPVVYEPVGLDDLVVMQKLMLSSARQYLGLLGGDIIRRIESANSEEKLRACVLLWHRAIRDSREGKQFAEALFQKVREVLHMQAE